MTEERFKIKRHFLHCARCQRWTLIETADYFDDIGIVCNQCSKAILLEPVTQYPIKLEPKKRSGLVRFIRGKSDEEDF